MKKEKHLLVIGGDRLGNYETLAPIANHIVKTHKYRLYTLFQDKKIISDLKKNTILNLFYSQGSMLSLSKYTSLVEIIHVMIYVLSSKNGLVLTNRPLVSPKFNILRFLFNLKGWRILYTKSFNRSPTENARSLIGGKGYALSKEELADFCLIPTIGHMIEYGVLGYRLRNMLVTGYPKMWKSWRVFINENTSCDESFDYLIAMGIHYEGYDKILEEVLVLIDSINPNSIISIKPHPTTAINIINHIIENSNIRAKAKVNINNVASQSICAGLTIVHGTSSCIDANIGSRVLCYWGKDKSLVDKYNESNFNDSSDFVIMESNKTCREFVDMECFTLDNLREKLMGKLSANPANISLLKEQEFDLIDALDDR